MGWPLSLVESLESFGGLAIPLPEGEPLPFCWSADGRGFFWCCPDDGRVLYGELGPAPVSGWQGPIWVNSGDRERPTLSPSLGCREMLAPGAGGRHHFWCREGRLLRA